MKVHMEKNGTYVPLFHACPPYRSYVSYPWCPFDLTRYLYLPALRVLAALLVLPVLPVLLAQVLRAFTAYTGFQNWFP
jgi:hypothetical protein